MRLLAVDGQPLTLDTITGVLSMVGFMDMRKSGRPSVP
jgi:hypothetical protein